MNRRSHPRRRCRSPLAPWLEQLESRRPLAFGGVGAAWTISGDTRPGAPADTIVVERDPAQSGFLRATVNDVVVGRRPEAHVGLIRIFGGAGDDAITVKVPGNTRLRTQLFGNAGDDTITAGDQNDEIRGGPGKDTISGGRGQDRVYGGAGDDTINGGAGHDMIAGGEGDDSLVGAAGNDSLYGEIGSDTLRGGDGRNTLDGGLGRDALFGTAERDTVKRFDAGETLIGNETTNPLRLATDVEQLKAWYIDTALARWGDMLGKETWRFGWWWRRDGALGVADMAVATTAAPAPATTGDFSGTNNQVAGVDEGDRVKTDGQHLFVLAGDGVDVVSAWPADTLAVVGHVATEGDERHLFLHGTRLTVISQEWAWSGLAGGAVRPALAYGDAYRWQSRVHVTVVDVTDPTQPTILEKTSLDGSLVDARAIDGRVLVVTQDALDIPVPLAVPVPPTAPSPEKPEPVVDAPVDGDPLPPMMAAPLVIGGGPFDRFGTRYVYEGLAEYRARLEAAWDESAMPRFTVSADAQATDGTLVAGGTTYLPVKPGDDRMLSVTSFTVGDATPGFDTATTVAGVSGSVYASAANLYVSASHQGTWWDASNTGTTTNIYQFDLTAAAVPLAAMGSVPGITLNQFSLDEHDGVLRVATTNGSWDGASSGVYVLSAFDGNLQTVGSVSGLAPGEDIYSVRFIGDTGYVCTFRRIDPLFVIDLATPSQPRVVGELKIPGYSSYLQPLDATHLLGVGQDADPETGRVLGLQLSIFDVADPTAPKRSATYTFAGDGWGSWSAAQWDHHALAWFPEYGVLTLPVQQGGWWQGASSLMVFHVDPAAETGFTLLGAITHDAAVERGLRIGEFLYSVSAGEVHVHRLSDPGERVAAVRLTPPTLQFGPIFAL